MVGGTSFPPHDSESETWSNEQKAKATPKPSTKGKSKPEAALPERSRLATRSLEVSLDNADRVIEGAPHIPVLCQCVGACINTRCPCLQLLMTLFPQMTLDNPPYNRNKSKTKKRETRGLSTYNSAPAVTYPAD